MTAARPRPFGSDAVKGLTKFRNHLRHAVAGKSVDVSPSRFRRAVTPQ